MHSVNHLNFSLIVTSKRILQFKSISISLMIKLFAPMGANLRAKSNEPNQSMICYSYAIVTLR